MKFRGILAVLASCFIMFSVPAAAQNAVSLSYDGDGNLVSKTVNGVTTQYLIDDMNPTGLPQVMEETVNGIVQRRYTYGQQRISETQLINGSWVTSNYVYDADGNVRQLTNAAGVVTDTYDYDAFGNLVNHTGSTPNVYLYKGERYDADLSMYYMRARWYNPATGRFMSRDPEEGDATDPASLHKYLYAGGDPVNKLDPTGKATIPFPVAPPAPQSKPVAGGLEYGLIIGIVAVGAIVGIEEVACEDKILYAEDTLGVQGMINITPERSSCTAKGECPPCNPPSGTQCYEPHSGHPHSGWDPHYHLWQQNQSPNTCKCYWNNINGPGGASQFPPPGVSECSSYPSWPAN